MHSAAAVGVRKVSHEPSGDIAPTAHATPPTLTLVRSENPAAGGTPAEAAAAGSAPGRLRSATHVAPVSVAVKPDVEVTGTVAGPSPSKAAAAAKMADGLFAASTNVEQLALVATEESAQAERRAPDAFMTAPEEGFRRPPGSSATTSPNKGHVVGTTCKARGVEHRLIHLLSGYKPEK